MNARGKTGEIPAQVRYCESQIPAQILESSSFHAVFLCGNRGVAQRQKRKEKRCLPEGGDAFCVAENIGGGCFWRLLDRMRRSEDEREKDRIRRFLYSEK